LCSRYSTQNDEGLYTTLNTYTYNNHFLNFFYSLLIFLLNKLETVLPSNLITFEIINLSFNLSQVSHGLHLKKL